MHVATVMMFTIHGSWPSGRRSTVMAGTQQESRTIPTTQWNPARYRSVVAGTRYETATMAGGTPMNKTIVMIE